jgi:hypothetical protein
MNKAGRLTLRHSLMAIVAVSLTAGVGYIAADTARRVATLGVFAEGHGMPTKSPPEAFQAAEWNVTYLIGLAVGVATGVGLSVATAAWWYLAWLRRRLSSDGIVPSDS